MFKQSSLLAKVFFVPKLNNSFIYNKWKPVIWIRTGEILLILLLLGRISEMLTNFTFLNLVLLAIAEGFILGLLRIFYEGPSQLYQHQMNKWFHISGIKALNLLTGQNMAGLPLMAWSALLFSIVLTSPYQGGEKLLPMLCLFSVSFSINILVDFLGRVGLVCTVNVWPKATKFLFAFSMVGLISIIGILIVSLFQMPVITKEQLVVFEVCVLIGGGLFTSVGLFLLLLFIRNDRIYENSWLKFQEQEGDIGTFSSQFTPILKKPIGYIIHKDLIIVLRNPITKIRYIAVLLLAPPIFWFLQNRVDDGVINIFSISIPMGKMGAAIMVILVLLALGEIGSTLFQNEGSRRMFMQIAAVSRISIIVSKIVATFITYLPMLFYIGIIGRLFLPIKGWEFFVYGFLFAFLIAVFQASVASFDKYETKFIEENKNEQSIMAQVPKKPFAVISFWASFSMSLGIVFVYIFYSTYLETIVLLFGLLILATFIISVQRAKI